MLVCVVYTKLKLSNDIRQQSTPFDDNRNLAGLYDVICLEKNYAAQAHAETQAM